MRLAFDLESIRQTLQKGIDNGHWTLEDLDRPAPGTHLLMREVARHPDPAARILSGKPHRNLLREVAQAERVEAAPAPRDFAMPAEEPNPYDF
jgi:hypothetical protein